MRLPKIPALPEPSIVEVLHLNYETRGDMLGDLVQPFALFAVKRHARIRLLLAPFVVTLSHNLGKRRERLAGFEGVTNERDKIGDDLPALAGGRGGFERFIAMPEFLGRRGNRRALD